MKKLAIIILFATFVFTSCNSSNTSGTALVVASDTATVKYQCPMKDQSDTTYTTAGKCPKCGMNLKKAN